MSSFRDFLKNIERTIVKLTVLEIRTVVGDYIIAPDNSVQPVAGGDVKIFETRINLLAGDIESNISNPLVYPEYDWVREFHARKEEKGHEIINSNIKAIMSLIELYKSAKNVAAKDTSIASPPLEITETTYTDLNTTPVGGNAEMYPPAQ
jgi:hypothetical protein